MADQTITISNAQQEDLRKALVNVKMMGSTDAFCTNWPAAKTVLDTLKTLLSLVPAVGLFAGPAIAIVIAAGDAAFSAVCKK